jgi:hypothetical protein
VGRPFGRRCRRRWRTGRQGNADSLVPGWGDGRRWPWGRRPA